MRLYGPMSATQHAGCGVAALSAIGMRARGAGSWGPLFTANTPQKARPGTREVHT